MRTTLIGLASSSLLVLCLYVPARAQGKLNPVVRVPEGKAPVLDGRIQAGDWADGYASTVRRAVTLQLNSSALARPATTHCARALSEESSSWSAAEA